MKISSEEKKMLKKFEKSLGYTFKKRAHLFIALTHKSYANERGLSPDQNNERYEFLGDAVLELSISNVLFSKYPEFPEGELSKIRAAVVNETQLAEIARALKLGDYLNLGKGEDMTGGRGKPSLLSDAYEAVLGAIYLDRGFPKAKKIIEKHFEKILKTAGKKGFYKDYKTRLQEISQAKFRTIPKYKLIKEIGPDHRKIFEINLYIANVLYGVGRGHSKKLAEQEAAKSAISKIESE